MNERQCCKPCCPQQNAAPVQNMPCASSCAAYALYQQTNLLSNSAPYDGINLSEVTAQSCGDFYSDGSTFQILKPGVYLITYIVNIPATVAVNTTFALQANRQNVPGTVRPVTKTATDAPYTAVAQTILEANAPVALRLSSSTQVTITGAATETMASLSIYRLVQCG